MGKLDAPLRKASAAVLGAFGTDITYRRILVGEYSAATGTTIRTEIDKDIKGRLDEYRQHEYGELILVGDRKLTVAASDLSFNPKTTDEVLIGTDLYRIVSVKSPQATDQAAVHIMQIRGAE